MIGVLTLRRKVQRRMSRELDGSDLGIAVLRKRDRDVTISTSLTHVSESTYVRISSTQQLDDNLLYSLILF